MKKHIYRTYDEWGTPEVDPRAVPFGVFVKRFKVTVEYEEDLEAERELLLDLWKKNGRNTRLFPAFKAECERLGLDWFALLEPDKVWL